MEQISDKVKERLISFYDDNPYVKYLRMEIEEIKIGSVRVGMLISAESHSNVYRVAHGGALMSIADTAMGAACMTMNKKVVTAEMNINCIKGAPVGQRVFAVSEVLHNGSQTIVAECEISDENGALYAKSRGTFIVIEKFVV